MPEQIGEQTQALAESNWGFQRLAVVVSLIENSLVSACPSSGGVNLRLVLLLLAAAVESSSALPS